MAKKAVSKAHKTRLMPFTVYFYLAGGTTIWLEELSESRQEIENRTRSLLDAPGEWMELKCHTGTMNVRRSMVVGYSITDIVVSERDFTIFENMDGARSNPFNLRLDDTEISLNDE